MPWGCLDCKGFQRLRQVEQKKRPFRRPEPVRALSTTTRKGRFATITLCQGLKDCLGPEVVPATTATGQEGRDVKGVRCYTSAANQQSIMDSMIFNRVFDWRSPEEHEKAFRQLYQDAAGQLSAGLTPNEKRIKCPVLCSKQTFLLCLGVCEC